MPSRAKTAGRGGTHSAAALRHIPSVDELLRRPRMQELIAESGRELALAETRAALREIRRRLSRPAPKKNSQSSTTAEEIETSIAESVRRLLKPSLRRVINATGVVLHTNLGRAPLSARALEHIREIGGRYSNLEFDLSSSARGNRDTHTAERLARLTGAEAAIVVNNNAAAVLLVLSVLAKDGEVIVSRGELIEIGGGFRIPEIMAESGAQLREAGTTNRTRIADYERGINERTRLLLRVHPSNFRLTGFTERPTLEELVRLAKKNSLPVFEDLGSGCLTNLEETGIQEPLARQSLEAGADVVAFSGDKLLGGPQAGIIAGRKKIVKRIRRSQLFRALRVDKLTIAALEETLAAYLRGAVGEIPAQKMLRATSGELRARAMSFAERLKPHLPEDAALEIFEGSSIAGGGATPEQPLPCWLIGVRSEHVSATQVGNRLRGAADGIPVIARIEKRRVVLDLRTVFTDEEGILACSLAGALR